jgi:hypothetical protein
VKKGKLRFRGKVPVMVPGVGAADVTALRFDQLLFASGTNMARRGFVDTDPDHDIERHFPWLRQWVILLFLAFTFGASGACSGTPATV